MRIQGKYESSNSKSVELATEQLSPSLKMRLSPHVVRTVGIDTAQFVWVAMERHRDLKQAFSASEKDSKLINTRFDALLDHVNLGARRITETVLSGLQTVLSNGTQSRAPRLCCKMKQDENVVDFVRFQGNGRERPPFRCSENTAFERIAKGAAFYSCPDIPLEFKMGRYVNARLDVRAKTHYECPGRFKRFVHSFAGQPAVDRKWTTFWDPQLVGGNRVEPDVAECYKSTIVVPVGIASSEFRSEFLQFTRGHNGSGQRDLPNVFAFICADHSNYDYFDIKADVETMRVAAALLVPTFATFQMLTTASRTYQAVSEYLESFISPTKSRE